MTTNAIYRSAAGEKLVPDLTVRILPGCSHVINDQAKQALPFLLQPIQ